MTVIVAICIIYVVLGTAMEELSMILLTVPVFFPLVVGLGFDPVWFGILIVVVVQIGLISPPVGMNMFVVKSMLPRIATATIFRGVTPFVVAEVVLLAVLVAFPSISLVLPTADEAVIWREAIRPSTERAAGRLRRRGARSAALVSRLRIRVVRR